MKEAKDIFNQDITAGDIILYTVSHGGGTMSTRLAIIDEVVTDEYSTTLKVRAYDDHHFVWNYDENNTLIDYKITQRLYHTTLTSNKTIVKLNAMTIPKGFVELLRASVV